MKFAPPSSAQRSPVASRRGIALVTAVLALAMARPDGSPTTAAEPTPAFSQLLSHEGFEVAQRGAPSQVTEPAPASEPDPEPEPDEPTLHERLAREVIEFTNAEREAADLPPLTWNPQLTTAALTHALDQRNVPCEIGSLSHVGSDGSNAGDRILRTGLDISRWAENIACAHRSAESVVRGWMRSPGHRSIILRENLTHIGVGVAASDSGQLYWVQTFATLR